MCTPATLASLRVGAEATLATSMVVREESLTLFGFADHDERVALRAAADGQRGRAEAGPGDARGARSRRAAPRRDQVEDLVALCKVPGIGRKGAQRIVLELKDRIGAPAGVDRQPAGAVPGRADGWRDTVRAGLLGLGWSAREADAALDAGRPARRRRRRRR